MADSQRKGFLNPRVVLAFSFWTTTACIVVATVATILAIWQFTGTDALWRTVATCAVIGAATLAFSFVNGLLSRNGETAEARREAALDRAFPARHHAASV
jgi:hypothetical protein